MIGPKLLIDTNILIGLEDNKETAANFSSLHEKCSANGVQLFVHEASKLDIARDKDSNRRRIILSKIEKFSLLEGIQFPSSSTLEESYGKIRNANDEVDVKLLYVLHDVDAVDFLITQDRGIHKRALQANIADRVFRVEDALVWLRETYEKIKVSLPFIEERLCHQLNRRDEIFDSLRADYNGFDAWFSKTCVKTHRECWTINIDEELAGIAIRKDEKYVALTHDVPACRKKFAVQPKKILKICTFKIKDKYRGEKLGEQLIKQVLWWANKNNYELVYLTVYPKQKTLVDMLLQYGFEMIARKNGELYLAKVFSEGVFKTPPASNALSYHRQYYPAFLSGKNVCKYLVPIKSEYYETLFPENVSKRQKSFFDSGKDFTQSKIPGNTIRKIYICHAMINSIEDGDILLFFHLKDENSLHSQSLITVGVADGFDVTCRPDEILKLSAKRSVFSPAELISLTDDGKRDVKVINFLLAGHISPAIFYDRLQEIGIKGPYQSIRSISYEHFMALEQEINLDVKTA